jgi:hypothetical protein
LERFRWNDLGRADASLWRATKEMNKNVKRAQGAGSRMRHVPMPPPAYMAHISPRAKARVSGYE